jgi:hypothetical protein
MKYKQPRQVLSPEIAAIAKREMKRQQIKLLEASPSHLKQMLRVVESIVDKGLPDNLVLMKLPKDLGHGIFLRPDAKPIRKEQLIAPYSGVISLSCQDAEDDSCYTYSCLDEMHLLKSEYKYLSKKMAYNPKRRYEMNLDAENSGNFTRFINHSDTPNVMAETIEIPANKYGLEASPIEIVYFAKKTILPGEQLLVSYEGEEGSFWGVMGIEPMAINPKTFTLSSSLELKSLI